MECARARQRTVAVRLIARGVAEINGSCSTPGSRRRKASAIAASGASSWTPTTHGSGAWISSSPTAAATGTCHRSRMLRLRSGRNTMRSKAAPAESPVCRSPCQDAIASCHTAHGGWTPEKPRYGPTSAGLFYARFRIAGRLTDGAGGFGSSVSSRVPAAISR